MFCSNLLSQYSVCSKNAFKTKCKKHNQLSVPVHAWLASYNRFYSKTMKHIHHQFKWGNKLFFFCAKWRRHSVLKLKTLKEQKTHPWIETVKQYRRSLIPELSGVSYNFNDASHVLRTDINICYCIPEMKMHCTKSHKLSKLKSNSVNKIGDKDQHVLPY